MPKNPSHILELARRGAEHRYTELKEEIARLVKTFPHLTGRKDGAAAASAAAPRRRRRMSAKARAAISAAQKARWARQKTGERKK
jgi:hypothetical protein